MAELVLREKDVCDLLGISRTSFWKLRREANDFPARRHICGDVVAWLRPEIEAWVMSRPVAERDQDDAA